MDEAKGFLGDLWRPGHADKCDSSCYDCLRDYYNMGYHPLLDWRLAEDIFAVLSGESINVPRAAEREHELAAGFADSFGGTAVLLEGGVSAVRIAARLLVITHPLESHDLDRAATDRLTAAIADAEDRGLGVVGRDIVLEDSFTMLRMPGSIASRELALS